MAIARRIRQVEYHFCFRRLKDFERCTPKINTISIDLSILSILCQSTFDHDRRYKLQFLQISNAMIYYRTPMSYFEKCLKTLLRYKYTVMKAMPTTIYYRHDIFRLLSALCHKVVALTALLWHAKHVTYFLLDRLPTSTLLISFVLRTHHVVTRQHSI